MLEQAETYLSKAIDLHPTYATGLLNLGLVYYKLGKTDLARQTWNRARTVYPNHPALEKFDAMLREHDLQDGIKLAQQGHVDEALPYFQRAVDSNPGDANAWFALGRAHGMKQDYRKAYECWHKAAEIDPGNAQVQKGLAILKRMGIP